MCDYTVLVHNENGYVILCNSCKHYQLAFGTTAATFELSQFRSFCKQVTNTLEKISDNGFEKQKRISLQLFCKCSMMVLSRSELCVLDRLLQEAAFSNEIENLFEDLNLLRE